ncbi:hypothetical protein PTE30175_01772 [Pandoraea terrae]|uniref:Uncharacterized protein n=1 Tax=Pandoraea terrae TaxID=1537710 RepID=A0A5E4U5B7_9BURK|nr:hypothetical protein PTE30175_01772 [Pandoraea terrae]
MLLDQSLRFAQTLLREHNGLRFLDGMANRASFMERVADIPIEAFPRAVLVMTRQ